MFVFAVRRPWHGPNPQGPDVAYREGVWVSLGFFDDVFVPGHALQQPSVFDEAEGLWAWQFDADTLVMELHEPVRLRVADVKFNPVPTPSQLKAEGPPPAALSACIR